MSAVARLTAFLAALVAAFAVALAVGQLVGPIEAADEPVAMDHDGSAGEEAGAHTAHAADPAPDLPGGLMVSQDGYTLDLARTSYKAGRDVPLRFSISGPDGHPVTAFQERHERDLHLIAVRRDLSDFQHVHPTLDDRGVWSVDLDLAPGDYRVLTDFQAAGAEPLTLGADVVVPGDYDPVALGADRRTATVAGYTVTLDGDLTAEEDAALTLRVSRDGRPVTDLEPYLGAYGHLVALRAGDLAYLHVHPDGAPGDGTTPAGPDVVFHTTAPSAGTYRLYLDFKHDGVVHTAAFTIDAARGDGAEGHAHDDGTGHR